MTRLEQTLPSVKLSLFCQRQISLLGSFPAIRGGSCRPIAALATLSIPFDLLLVAILADRDEGGDVPKEIQ